MWEQKLRQETSRAARGRRTLLMDVFCCCGFAAVHQLVSVTLCQNHQRSGVQELFRVYFPFVMGGGEMHRQANSEDVTFCILYPDY